MFPENIIRSMFSQIETIYSNKTKIVDGQNLTMIKTSSKYIEGINVLGIIVFSASLIIFSVKMAYFVRLCLELSSAT